MTNTPSLDDLLDFLAHASERGLMPAATAQSLAVACRNVFGVLNDEERAALPISEIDAVIRRFTNKRAKDFNPSSLKEYGRRVRRAVELYVRWRESPADFTVKTRATSAARRKERADKPELLSTMERQNEEETLVQVTRGPGYQTAFPIRPGHVVTIASIPSDLSAAEAERLAQFIKMLATV